MTSGASDGETPLPEAFEQTFATIRLVTILLHVYTMFSNSFPLQCVGGKLLGYGQQLIPKCRQSLP